MRSFVFAVCLLLAGLAQAGYGEHTGRLVDDRLTISYNPAHAPDWLAVSAATEMIQRAAAKWAECGVRLEMGGLTNRSPEKKDGVSVIGWARQVPSATVPLKGETGVRANFAMDRNLLGLSRLRMTADRIAEADMLLSAPDIQDLQGLETVILHELGHWIGLIDHSPFRGSVMNKQLGVWAATRLSPEDLDRCQRIYQPRGNR